MRRPGHSPLPLDSLLDEIRLEPEAYCRIQRDAVVRNLIVTEASRHNWPVEDDLVRRALAEFRDIWGLSDEASLDNWLALNDLDRGRLDALIRTKAVAEHYFRTLSRVMEPEFINTIILNNEYYQWVQRYEDKRDHLQTRGYDNPGLNDIGLAQNDLLEWFFRGQGLPVPADLRGYVDSLGFRDYPSFLQAILKDYIYKNL